MFVPFEEFLVKRLLIGTTWPAYASRRFIEALLRCAPQRLDKTLNVQFTEKKLHYLFPLPFPL